METISISRGPRPACCAPLVTAGPHDLLDVVGCKQRMPGQAVGNAASRFTHPRAYGGGDDWDATSRWLDRTGGYEVHIVEATVMVDWSFMQIPDPPDQRYEFFNAQSGCADVGDAVPVAHHPLGAVADAEHDAPSGQLVEVASFGRENEWAAPDAVEDRRANATCVGSRGYCRHRD